MRSFGILVAAGFMLCSAQAIDINFVDVANEVGLDYSGPSFGQSWGDYDRDGFADIYFSAHGVMTTIYRNQSGVTFSNEIANITADLDGDIHGGAWGDFDNDGDRDLLFIEGTSGGAGQRPNRLLLNTNGSFVDVAAQSGAEYSDSRGRMATWFDWNLDGELDMGLANWPRNDGLGETALLTQQNSTFEFDNPNIGFMTTGSNNFLSLLDVEGYPEPLLLVHTVFGFPEGLYDMSQVPFVDVIAATGLPAVPQVRDFIAADFNGDLQQDLFFVRQAQVNEVVQVDSNNAQARLVSVTNAGPAGMQFSGPDVVTFTVGPEFSLGTNTVKIGLGGYSPTDLTFSLDRNNPDNVGDPQIPGTVYAVKIFYNDITERWQIESQGGLRMNVSVSADQALSNIESIGFTSDTGALAAVLLKRTSDGFSSTPFASGLTANYPCSSVTAADFDNDMDLDVYMACASSATNRSNILLENDGTGRFTEVVGSAGASGTSDGLADVVVTADYNNDGFIDLLVSNGSGTPMFATGPIELFENQGNDNHWLHVDLTGTTSNRDGIGARVEVEAGGKTQRLLQNNGTHRFAQNDQRLHFGLAGHTVVDRITVRWPGGQLQELTNVQADQILSIVQPVDSDNDSVPDEADNCRLLANASQLDSDADGFGNRCDPDLNNDLIVNFLDVSLFSEVFLSSDETADFNQDGAVNFLDFSIMTEFFLLPPGPGGLEESID